MSLSEVFLEGTLNQDGTVDLDTRPNLPPGRVQIILRQHSHSTNAASTNWWQAMQSARKEMEAAGCHFLDDRGMQEQIDWLREEDHIDQLLRESEGRKH